MYVSMHVHKPCIGNVANSLFLDLVSTHTFSKLPNFNSTFVCVYIHNPDPQTKHVEFMCVNMYIDPTT